MFTLCERFDVVYEGNTYGENASSATVLEFISVTAMPWADIAYILHTQIMVLIATTILRLCVAIPQPSGHNLDNSFVLDQFHSYPIRSTFIKSLRMTPGGATWPGS